MPKTFEGAKTTLAKLETPFTIQQVETHLIFGPFSRHLPFGYVILVGGIISLVWTLFYRSVPLEQQIGEIIGIVIVIVWLPLVFLRMTWRQQAIAGWVGVKFGLGFAAFMMMMIGGFGGLTQGH